MKSTMKGVAQHKELAMTGKAPGNEGGKMKDGYMEGGRVKKMKGGSVKGHTKKTTY